MALDVDRIGVDGVWCRHIRRPSHPYRVPASARAPRIATETLNLNSAEQLLRSAGADQVDRATIAKMGIEPLQRLLGGLGRVETQETREDQLKQVDPYGVGKIDPAATAPTSESRGNRAVTEG